MLNGTFGKWLREFATLVLTQTVQAFLLAVVMTIIIACLGSSNSTGEAESNQAAGLLAIIALASFSKIEMLVKNIFGVTSQFGDPSLSAGAKGLTAGGVLAMKGASRLKDNVGKSIEGRRKIAEAQKGLTALGSGSDGSTSSDGSSKGSSTNNSIDSGQDDSSSSNKVVTDSSLGDTTLKLQGIDGLSQAIQTLSNNIQTQNGGSQREKYEAMLKEGKDMKRSARRENIGAAIGATAGAMAGLAKGDGIAAATLTGAGAGDAIGQASANAKARKIDHNKKMDELDAKIGELSVEQYDKNIEELDKALKSQGMMSTAGIKNAARKGGIGAAVSEAGSQVRNKASVGVSQSVAGDAARGARAASNTVKDAGRAATGHMSVERERVVTNQRQRDLEARKARDTKNDQARKQQNRATMQTTINNNKVREQHKNTKITGPTTGSGTYK